MPLFFYVLGEDDQVVRPDLDFTTIDSARDFAKDLAEHAPGKAFTVCEAQEIVAARIGPVEVREIKISR